MLNEEYLLNIYDVVCHLVIPIKLLVEVRYCIDQLI